MAKYAALSVAVPLIIWSVSGTQNSSALRSQFVCICIIKSGPTSPFEKDD